MAFINGKEVLFSAVIHGNSGGGNDRYDEGYADGEIAGYESGYNKGVEDTTPKGEVELTENGTHDVSAYASAQVSVVAKLQEKTAIENGEVLPDDGYDGLSKVTVNVASSGGDGENKLLTTIEGTVTDLTAADFAGLNTIRKYAFAYCNSLKNIYIPGNIKSIGEYAFYNLGYANLESIYVADGVTTLGAYCFSNTTPFRKNTIRLPVNTLTALPNSLFSNNQNMLGEYVFGKQMTSVGANAFDGCYMVSKIELPDTVTSIGQNAFRNCISITSFKYPANLTSIPNSAFNMDRELVEFIFPNNLQTIGTNAFDSCTKFAVPIPDTVTSIGSYAFNNTGYEVIETPSSVTSIPSNCFSNCQAAKSITIGENVTSIGNQAFYRCLNITTINFNARECKNLSSNYNYVFYECGKESEGVAIRIGNEVKQIPSYIFSPYNNANYAINVKSVTFEPTSVCKTLGVYAFGYMNKLLNISIPKSVTQINNYVFSGCSALEYIDLTDYGADGTFPSFGVYVFQDCPSTFQIRVPSGRKAELSAMTNWSAYADNIVEV